MKKLLRPHKKKNIKFLTLYVFSTENWKRPLNEIKYLFTLLEKYIDKELENLKKKKIKIKVIGDISPFPKRLKNKISKVEKLTKNNEKIQINMALNYGSRQEIVRSFKIMKKKLLSINLKILKKICTQIIFQILIY